MTDARGTRAARWGVAVRAGWDLTWFWLIVRVRPAALAVWRSRPAAPPAGVAGRLPTRPDEAGARAIVQRVARLHPLKPACLEQALASCAALRRRGDPAWVVIGVRRHGAGLAAHAWIESAVLPRDPLAAEYLPLEPPGGMPGHAAFLV